MKNKESKGLPCFIESFEIKNFKGIKETKIDNLPANANWIFLTGENGFGKTSVLQGVASELRFFSRKRDNSSTLISVEYQVSKKYLHHIGMLFQTDFLWMAGYGSSRLNIRPRSNQVEDEDSSIASLFDSRIVLKNIELELSRWYFKKDYPEFKEKFENVTKALKNLIPRLSEIHVDPKTDKVTYQEKDEAGELYEPVNYNQLAAGYKSLIALAGDMMLRLFETQPDTTDPSELIGIVIIDEIDLHFHPNIQRKLPKLFSDIFPKIQFIVSTHSPIPILGAPKNSVFLKVNRTKEEGVTVEKISHIEIENLTPNTILTSPIFGFTDILAETHNPKNRARTELTYDEMKINDTVEQRLEAFADSTENEFDGLFGKENKTK